MRLQCSYSCFSLLLLLFFLNHSMVAQSNGESFYNSYDVGFYWLDLEVSNKHTDIHGMVRIDAVWKSNSMDTLIFDLTVSNSIDSVLLNQLKRSYIHENDLLKIPLDSDLSIGEKFTAEIFYKLENVEDPGYKGIYNKSLSDGKQVTWTLSEPFYSKHWFPCKQDLLDKADSSWFFITLDSNLLAGSNGLLRNIVMLENGKKRLEWKSKYPIAYYLISFAVAEYIDYSFMASVGNGDSVLVQNYIYNDSAFFQNNKSQIDITADMIESFSEQMGTYPFRDEKYGHCIAPVGGGMEHQTMTTLGNFGFKLVAHELAHQWYGNNVTCSNWQDIWVNEGFASYGELLALEKFRPAEVPGWISATHSRVLGEPDGSVYVPESEITNANRIFDYRLTYRKGASIIHMLRHEIGDDLFFDVLRTFQDRFSDSVATGEDFKYVVEEFSGNSYKTYFDQWYYGEGYPLLSFQWQQRNDSLIIYTEQEASAPDKTSFFELLIDIKAEFLGGDTLLQFKQENPSQVFTAHMPFSVFRLIPDPDEWLLREIVSVTRILPDDSTSLFNVFPNPTLNEVYIENYEIGRPFDIEIYNIAGVLVTTGEGSEAFTEINMTTFAPGIYQIIIKTEGSKEIFQIAKL